MMPLGNRFVYLTMKNTEQLNQRKIETVSPTGPEFAVRPVLMSLTAAGHEGQASLSPPATQT